MKSAEAAAIKALIKKKRAALEKLKAQEAQLKKLQAEVAAIPKVAADLAAAERTLRMLNKEEEAEPQGTIPLPELMKTIMATTVTRSDSIPSLVYWVLKEAGKPQTSDQIMPLLAARGRTPAKTTVLGSIYRCIKKGQLFKLVAPGTFGLLEWK